MTVTGRQLERELLDLVLEQQAALTRRAELIHELLEELVAIHRGDRVPGATRRLDRLARRLEEEADDDRPGPGLRAVP